MSKNKDLNRKQHQVRRTLTDNNRKNLLNQCKMGYVIALMVFMFVSIIGITVYETVFDSDKIGINPQMALVIVGCAFLFALLLVLAINGKYFSDIRTNEKLLLSKTLAGKLKSNDAIGFKTTNLSKDYLKRCEFVVDDIKFLVDEALFENCQEGDKLVFSYAPKSMYLLEINKSKGQANFAESTASK